MKKILFAALAALAITSCSQNEEIEAPTQKTEINFRSVVGKSSRAAEATTENLESQGFILYAYNTKTITMDKVTAGMLACMGGVLLAGCIMGILSVLGVSAFGAVVQ